MVFLPFVDQTSGPFWEWWLVDSSDMSQIGVLNAHNRQLQVQLNSQGKASCWVHLLDEVATEVACLETGLRCDRDGETVWSGRIFNTTESSQASTGNEEGQDELQITAMGWFQNLNQRILHTGAEFAAMLVGPNGVLWQAQNGAYSSLGIDTAIQLAYDVIEFPQTSDAAIIFDLLDRANIDSTTRITAGNIYGMPYGRNLTLQRFQSIGQQIVQLCNVENGVDFVIDPLTRKMDLYGPAASNNPALIPNGLGVDRGQGCLFTYPGNCTSFQRTRDGTQTANRVEATGQYSVGRADDLTSQAHLDLYEINDQLSEVVDPNILAAYANAEVAVRSRPWTVVTFTPRGATSADESAPGVPRPFKDFDLGDVVYCVVNRGATQIGTNGPPQATRLFGFTIAIDDSGVEKLSSIQTTYQALGTGAG